MNTAITGATWLNLVMLVVGMSLLLVLVRARRSVQREPYRTAGSVALLPARSSVIRNEYLTVVVPLLFVAALLASYLNLFAEEAASTPSNDGLQLQVLGNQWWWSFVRSNVPNAELQNVYPVTAVAGGIDWFESSDLVVLPAETAVSFTVTSSDVMHSFYIPSLGIKVDAIPGRLNTGTISGQASSTYQFGACAELCGAYHASMPFELVWSDIA